MASYTPNYNLKKPAGTDPVQISDINGNMEIIDTQLKATNDQIGSFGNCVFIGGSNNSAEHTETLLNNHKFSEFRYLWVFSLSTSAQVQNSWFIPVELFILYSESRPLIQTSYIGSRIWNAIKYVSDTQFTMQFGGDTTQVSVGIYGVK